MNPGSSPAAPQPTNRSSLLRHCVTQSHRPDPQRAPHHFVASLRHMVTALTEAHLKTRVARTAPCEQSRSEGPQSLLLTIDSLRQTAPSARHAEPRTGRRYRDQGRDSALKSTVSLRHRATPRPWFRSSNAYPTSIRLVIPTPLLKVDRTAQSLSTLIIIRSLCTHQRAPPSSLDRLASPRSYAPHGSAEACAFPSELEIFKERAEGAAWQKVAAACWFDFGSPA
jgi:hypothetical protein